MKEVIDTRFLLEYSNSTKSSVIEKAHRKLKSLTEQNEGILPTIVIAEMVQLTCDRLGKDMAASIFQALVHSGLEIQSLSPQIADQAGLYKSSHKNLPMGDCIIVATALLNHARILSDDPHFDGINEIKRVWI